jgi:hypothetical protein
MKSKKQVKTNKWFEWCGQYAKPVIHSRSIMDTPQIDNVTPVIPDSQPQPLFIEPIFTKTPEEFLALLNSGNSSSIWPVPPGRDG